MRSCWSRYATLVAHNTSSMHNGPGVKCSLELGDASSLREHGPLRGQHHDRGKRSSLVHVTLTKTTIVGTRSWITCHTLIVYLLLLCPINRPTLSSEHNETSVGILKEGIELILHKNPWSEARDGEGIRSIDYRWSLQPSKTISPPFFHPQTLHSSRFQDSSQRVHRFHHQSRHRLSITSPGRKRLTGSTLNGAQKSAAKTNPSSEGRGLLQPSVQNKHKYVNFQLKLCPLSPPHDPLRCAKERERKGQGGKQ